MTGSSSGDAEDLLGQFLAHRSGPAPAPPRATPPPAEQAEPADEPGPEAEAPAAQEDEALEESVDGPVYELTDAPLDFSEPDPPVADTMAHAGAVLEAFASGTLELPPAAAVEVAPDAALDDEVLDVDPDAEDLEVDPVPPPSSPANDASRAVLAAFLGTTSPDSEPAPATEPVAGSTRVPEPEREPEAPPAAPDEVAAFEQLAVSSPLTRESSGATAHRAPEQFERPEQPGDRPDATAASATVFAAFQEQLARQESAPAAPPSARHKSELREEPAGAVEAEPQQGEPQVESQVDTEPEPQPDAEQPIAPPVARAQAPKPSRQRRPRAEPKVTAPRLPAATPAKEKPRPAVPNEVVFRPRRMARALVALILVVFVAASAAACWWAYRDRTLVPVGIAATVLIATGIVWATRAGSTVARLSVKGGRLEITKDGTRTVFDLASQYTEIEVRGTPGKRGWRVLFGRRGLPPFVVDATMVSPSEFMRVLDYYRSPENRPSSR